MQLCWFYGTGISAVSWFYNGECSYVGSVMLDEVVLVAGVRVVCWFYAEREFFAFLLKCTLYTFVFGVFFCVFVCIPVCVCVCVCVGERFKTPAGSRDVDIPLE